MPDNGQNSHPFQQICIIGIGLIGSSLARAIREHELAEKIVVCDHDAEHLSIARRLGLGDDYTDDAGQAVMGSDLVIIATPLGTYDSIGRAISPHLIEGCILSDVGSTKQAVIDALTPHTPDHVHLIPGHPVAGTENSGPEAGFASLFTDRWAILTPPDGTDANALKRLSDFWTGLGSNVECMTAEHHDLVLAVTSHLPHLIAFNIVGTARHLEEVTQSEVIKYSAGGFRDFTRIAGSDPTMWRDVFLNNKDAVLEMLGRFSEDLTALQRAIRYGDGDQLFESFDRTRRIRQQLIDAGPKSPEQK